MKYSIAIALALTAPLAAMAQTTVFSDNFTGASTLQSATPGTGTTNSADYEVFTSVVAPSGNTIAANNLNFGTTSTKSGLGEVEAQFGGSPVTLATIGDSITLDVTFVDSGNVLIAGQNSNASLNIGLFNSGGVHLNQGVQLDGTQITGGSQTWQGYASRLFLNGNANSYNRASQTIGASTTSQNQDLIFNNASSSASYVSPVGTTTTSTFGTTTPLGNNVGLVQGNTYTISYTIALTAANAVKVTDELFNGSTATGTALQDNGGTSTGTAFLGSSFDSLAFGYRYASATAATAGLDINDINVTFTPAPAPEPTTLALSAIGGLGLLAVRRFKNKK
jgi:hypothetical protein